MIPIDLHTMLRYLYLGGALLFLVLWQLAEHKHDTYAELAYASIGTAQQCISSYRVSAALLQNAAAAMEAAN